MTLLKNVVLWDRSLLRSIGVPTLFGLFPLRCQFADEKAPNKLGIPTGEAFFQQNPRYGSPLRSEPTQPALAPLSEQYWG